MIIRKGDKSKNCFTEKKLLFLYSDFYYFLILIRMNIV